MKNVILASLMIIGIQSVAGSDWPQWRGTNRDGVLTESSLPEVWPDSLKLTWRVPVGAGYSSPVAANGSVYVIARKNDQEVVSRFNLKDGSTFWVQVNPAPFNQNQYAGKQGKGPFSTPTLHNGRLYTLGVNGLLSCFEVESGDLLWRKEFTKQVNTSKLFCGTAMSPIIYDGLCIVHVGDDFAGALIAHDAATGKIKWTWKEQGPGYASPVIFEIEGSKQLITLTDKACIGVEPTTGKLLWQYAFEDEWHENIVTPVFHNGYIILSGVRKGTLAIKPQKAYGGWVIKTVWHNKQMSMYMSSPIIIEDLLTGFSNKRKGQFFTVNPKTGETLWESEGRHGNNAALINSGDILLALTTDGGLMVFNKNGAEFQPRRLYKVANTQTWSQPAIVGNSILIKDEQTLALWTWE